MRDEDFDSFQSMLDSVCGLISRGKYTPNAEGAALFFNALKGYELATVSAAFSAHVKDPARGKFAPTPADLIAQIDAVTSDGRPGAEEAWAMVPMDEAQTVVWTNEMAEAHGVCQPLLSAGDKIGARMAFKEAYERIVAQAKRTGQRPKWSASLGHDLALRKQALTRAVEQGKLTAEDAFDACPALPMPASARLSLPSPQPGRRQSIRERLSELAKAKHADTERTDPLAWARDLRDKEKAGGNLTQGQKDAWRNALDAPAAFAGVTGGFTPIPDHVLPPGMRKDGRP